MDGEVVVEHDSRVVALLLRLLSISSPSGKEEALTQTLTEELRALGFDVERDQAGNVIARLEGEGEPLLLCAHMDTVEPTEDLVIVRDNGLIRTDGSTILGADDKAGIAAVLESVRTARKHPPLEVVFTVREEVGLQGALALDLSKLRSRRGIVLDTGGDICTVVTGAPSQYRLVARVIGKAAHAGASPEKGINAIAVAAKAITRMKLGRVDDETTANIGRIRGGVATNIVPESVEMWGEARSHSEEKLSAQVDAMRQALESAAAEAGARVEIECERCYTCFAIADSHDLVRAILDTAERESTPGSTAKGGGGSDANVFNLAGLQCVNFSVGMEGAHSKEESIATADLERASALLARVLEELVG
jgi:tripeptide aminopeptidase